MRITRKLLAVLLLPFLFIHVPAATATDLNTEQWLDDFAELKQMLSDTYPNLRDKVSAQNINLVELSDLTRRKIEEAESYEGIMGAFSDFIRAFDDLHLRLNWPSPISEQENSVTSEPEPVQSVCEMAGFFEWQDRRALKFSSFSGWSPVETPDSNYLPIGIAPLDGKTVGTLRIGLFMSLAYPDLCESAMERLGINDESECDEDCQQDLFFEAENQLTEILVRQIEELNRRNIDALLVDVTQNGGGTDWAEIAARVLTTKEIVSPGTGFIAHRHWQEEYGRQIESVETDIATASPIYRPLLERSLSTLESAMSQAMEMCDRSDIWETNRFPDCQLVKRGHMYSTGLLSTESDMPLRGFESQGSLFFPSFYSFEAGAYDGELLLATDSGTASSAELFAATLRDNDAARLIGQTTIGVGCGYIGGQIEQVLTNSGARLIAPNCTRHRKDGTNEALGVGPDYIVDWQSDDTDEQKVEKLFDRLRAEW